MFGPVTRRTGRAASSVLSRIGLKPDANIRGLAEGLDSLADADARRAFVHTARSVIDPRGQRVDARDRLYLSQRVPTLLVWGGNDRIIPLHHGRGAHELMPSSRFEIFPDAGHFPFNDDPERFVELLTDFIATTTAADLTADSFVDLLRGPTETSARGASAV
jgi:pimeloyl-ACP methyl ester carboxylesterase